MPYLYLSFDEAVDASMRDAANRIASGSAFAPGHAAMPFHVPLLGSLHVYSRAAIGQATASAPTALRGRFVEWKIHADTLRATVELDGAVELINQLQQALPRGRPWKAHYVALGSVAGIEAAQHDTFLAAVREAFPIDATMHFTTARLEYDDTPPPPRDATMKRHGKHKTKLKLNPLAAPFMPMVKRQAAHTPSPHMKWERDATATGSSIDDLIRTGGTGVGTGASTARRAAQAKRKSAVGRAEKLDAARKVWVARPPATSSGAD